MHKKGQEEGKGHKDFHPEGLPKLHHKAPNHSGTAVKAKLAVHNHKHKDAEHKK